MLSPQEIEAYIQGAAGIREKDRFSFDEAREIGDALGVSWAKLNIEEFASGLNVELEHGRKTPETDVTHDDSLLTGKIALAHLNEIPDYYTRLAVMREEAERGRDADQRGGL
jgi:hypothetical protein